MDIENFAGTIIINKDKILLVKESHKEAKNLWSLPLGHVEKNEKLEEGAIRETKEETGLDVVLDEEYKTILLNNQEFKSINRFNKSKIKLTIFKVKNFKGIVKKGTDILDIKWFNLSDIENIELRNNWVNDIIKNFV